MKTRLLKASIWAVWCCLFFSCGDNTADVAAGDEAEMRTPVTVTEVSMLDFTDYAMLTATSKFMQQNFVKANVMGYVQTVNTTAGARVNAGQVLFVLKTKEAQSIGNAVNKLDPSFRFSGISRLKAPCSGFVMQINHQEGDYVQDGEQLAVISDAQSFAFLLNLPYSLRPYLERQKTVQLFLPDSTRLTGHVASFVASVDPASQTQQVIITVPDAGRIPENLIANVRIIKNEKANVQALPKTAVLSDETQTQHWVMQLMNDSTAVRTEVTIGLEMNGMMEITTPRFNALARILTSGNYGLDDTASVIVKQKPQQR